MKAKMFCDTFVPIVKRVLNPISRPYIVSRISQDSIKSISGLQHSAPKRDTLTR